MDNEMVEIIRKVTGALNAEYVSKRLHDAGYRKVPSIDDLAVEIYVTDGYTRKCWNEESPGFRREHLRRAQAIHDLMMGGK